MADRFFVDSPIRGETVVVSGPEAHHLAHVMRATPGGKVRLFDGTGVEYIARVVSIARREVHLAILSAERVDRELALDLTLGAPLPKGDRQKWLVEKAVELGVRRLVPLRTARAVAQPRAQAVARLRRAVIEASKQCGRNRLMDIGEPMDWAAFLALGVGRCCRLVAHPAAGASTAGCPHHPLWPAQTPPEQVLMAIGPEGGFTADEVAQAVAAGWQTIDLGPRILRVETAAILLVALVLQSFA